MELIKAQTLLELLGSIGGETLLKALGLSFY